VTSIDTKSQVGIGLRTYLDDDASID